MFGGLFGRSSRRSTTDATRALRDALAAGRASSENAGENSGDEKEMKRVSDEIARTVRVVKDMLFPEIVADEGAQNIESEDTNGSEDHIAALVELARTTDLLLVLVDGLSVMGFETRKDAVQVFNNLLRRALADRDDTTGGGAPAGAELISRDGATLVTRLVLGYDDAEVALNCGAMLRECVRCEALAALTVRSAAFWRFFDLVEVSDFDVASDAFASFRETLTRHVQISAQFVDANFDRFVAAYNKLLRSANYVTRRQSLKLLGVLLVERKFFKIMTRYIASATNLRLVMNLLLDQRKNIQYEAFHVFKIFVANPNKTAEVTQILLRNKERMLAYLADFQADRQDVPFQEDRALILDEIRRLE